MVPSRSRPDDPRADRPFLRLLAASMPICGAASPSRLVAILAALALLIPATATPAAWAGQATAEVASSLQEQDEEQEPDEGDEPWDVTEARGETREIDFTTEEGTWMSVDVSPDGEWIVFDLLAHVYRMPIGGGPAEVLTQDSGVAVNYHPRYSPDGRWIAFVSDRRGQTNLWVMESDGSNPRQVFHSMDIRVTEPAWTADGEFIVVRRRGGGDSGLYMYHRDGGTGVELVTEESGASWASPTADGRHLYFQVTDDSFGTYRNVFGGDYQLARLDLETGDVMPVTSGTGGQQYRGSSGGAFAPQVSPDGRWLAFARRVEGTISYKGHRFGPRTALWLRDLRTGAEAKVMDPIEQDMTEGMKVLRILPGYTWHPDGGSIVLSQGGKIRRLHLGSGDTLEGLVDVARVETIPFEARVRRTISEQAWEGFRITDEPFRARFLRWHTGSPSGDRVVFQAVGRIWVQALAEGTPRRLTPDDFEPFEFAPAWSPDGRWVAFTTWDDEEGGHVWKVRVGPADGAPVRPERLTTVAGEYVHPAWSPDGSEVVVARGSGVTERGRTLTHNPWYELVRVPAGGIATGAVGAGAPPDNATVVTRVDGGGGRRQLVRGTWNPDDRIYFPARDVGEESRNGLVSVRPDGSDRRAHLTFPYADEIAPSPTNRWVAFQEGDNVYVSPFPRATAGEPVHLEKDRGSLPVTRITHTGGLFPRWRDETTLEFGSGPTYYVWNMEDAREAAEAARRQDAAPAGNAGGNPDAEGRAAAGGAGQDQAPEEQEAEAYEPVAVEIDLRVDRGIPDGTLAITGGRIVTLDDRRVIENGTLVIDGARIACVGEADECDASGAFHTIDARGKTLVPGFVDMHAHHYREHSAIIPEHNFESAIYLAYGVTTNLDNSMWSQSVFTAAELIDAGEVVGPRTFSTGDPLYRDDGSRQNELTSYEAARNEILRLKSWGAVSIKQYLQPQRDQRQWVSDIARDEGLMVTSEGSDLAYNLSMIMDGQTAWEHPMSYMPIYSDAARFFGRAGAVYSPTFIVGGPGAWNEEYFFQETELWKDPKQRRWLPWRQLLPHTRRRMLRPETDYSFPLVAQGMADIIAEGGWGAIGSHGQQHGIGSHWEIWMAASAMGPHGALEVASLHGAHFLGAERDIGSLENGKLADLIVLNSNPLDDIRNTLDMEFVVKGGVVHEADTLDEVWPRQRPFGDFYWMEADVYTDDDRPVDWWDSRQEAGSGARDGGR